MAKVIIHIGLPKTATTTLQGCLFSKLHKMKLVNFIGKKPATKEDKAYQLFTEVLSAIILDDNDKFNKNLNETIAKADELLKEGILNVISDEVLAMYFFNIDIVMKVKRIKTIFTNHQVTLLLSLRKQDELVYSLYVELYQAQFYHDKANNTLDKFISNASIDISQGYFLMFYYDKVLQVCAQEFGVDNTTILLFEDIKFNKAKYYKQLADTLVVTTETIRQCIEGQVLNEKQKHMKGYQSKSVKLDQYIKKVLFRNPRLKKMLKTINKGPINFISQKLMRSIRKIPAHSKTIPYLTKDQKAKIMKKFISSNKLIDEKYGLGLKQYNFYL